MIGDVIAWVAAYLGFVALVIAAVHRIEIAVHAGDEGAGDRQPEVARREVESVPVHEEVGAR